MAVIKTKPIKPCIPGKHIYKLKKSSYNTESSVENVYECILCTRKKYVLEAKQTK